MSTEAELCQEWENWCALESLPCMSADELLHERNDTLTTAQRRYISDFIIRWDECMKRDARLIVGARVKLDPAWRGNGEADAVYRIVEDRGLRLLIELECDLPIKPQECVAHYMVQPCAS